MDIKELSKKYKNGELNIEFNNLDLSKVEKIEFVPDVFMRTNHYLDNVRCLSAFSSNLDIDDVSVMKSSYLDALIRAFDEKKIWDIIEIQGEFSKKDFERVFRLPKSQQTERLIFLLKNYQKYLPLEKINYLIGSIRNPGLKEPIKQINEPITEEEKQSIQLRLEIYKEFSATRLEDGIAEKYEKILEYINYDKDLLVYLLENKNYEESIRKTKDKKRIKNYNKLTEKMSKNDIDEVLNYIRKIKSKFKIPYENFINDIEALSEYDSETERISILIDEYTVLLGKEQKEENRKKLEDIRAKYIQDVRSGGGKKESQNHKKEEKIDNSGNGDKTQKADNLFSRNLRNIRRAKSFNVGDGDRKGEKQAYEEEKGKVGPKEHVKVAFITWFFHKGKSLKESLSPERIKKFFEGLKKLSEKEKSKISLFVFSDESSDNCLSFIQEMEAYLQEYDVPNVIIEGMTGEHGRFMLDRGRKLIPMYELTEENYKTIREYTEDMCPGFDKYIDESQKSFLQYRIPAPKKGEPTIQDYQIIFMRSKLSRVKDLFYLPITDSQTDMIVITREQSPKRVKEKIIEYYRNKYFFDDGDIIRGNSSKDRDDDDGAK